MKSYSQILFPVTDKKWRFQVFYIQVFNAYLDQLLFDMMPFSECVPSASYFMEMVFFTFLVKIQPSQAGVGFLEGDPDLGDEHGLVDGGGGGEEQGPQTLTSIALKGSHRS